MAGKTHPVRLGVFIFIGIALIVTAIFLIGNKESMFRKTFTIKANFPSIEGLRNGAPVRLSGIDVGSVKEIRIAPSALGQVEVTMKLNNDIRPYLKEDATATVETEGLVGNKVVTLQIGTPGAIGIQDGGVIRGITPIGFGAIIEQAQGTMVYVNSMMKNLAEIVEKVNNGQGAIGKFINRDELYYHTNDLVVTADRSLNSISTKLDSMAIVVNVLLSGTQSVIKNVDGVILEVDKIVGDIKQGKGLVGELLVAGSPIDTSMHSLLANLLAITENTKSGAAKFEENMEALKRNWLFKSYYEQRGYYDKTEYEKSLDKYINQINDRLRTLDERIETLRKLKAKQKE
ncbi:MAG: MlaD family protein [Ignavibacteria bacterium]|nr:MlaD family protein [Ignavibacteria bacterium]